MKIEDIKKLNLYDYNLGTKSVVRNPVIASLLHRADYIEKIGTGISRIKNAVRDHRHSTVEFIFTEFFTVRFSRGKISVEDSTAKGDLIVDGTLSGGLNGGLNGTLNGGLSRVLKNLYDYVLTHPGIKINELSESLNRPVDTLDKQIRNLIGKDFIVRRSSKKTGGYWVTGTDSELDGTLSGGLNGTLSSGLNGTLNLLFECINETPGIQAHTISEKLDRPLDTVKKQIKKLVDKDLVERRGSKKTGGYWVI